MVAWLGQAVALRTSLSSCSLSLSFTLLYPRGCVPKKRRREGLPLQRGQPNERH